MSGNLLILFLVFFPFAAGLVNYLLGRHNKTGRDRVAILITAIELAATIVLVAMSLEPLLIYIGKDLRALAYTSELTDSD